VEEAEGERPLVFGTQGGKKKERSWVEKKPTPRAFKTVGGKGGGEPLVSVKNQPKDVFIWGADFRLPL